MLLPLALLAFAQTAAAGPDPTLPPQGTSVVALAEGRGTQIYHCAASGNTFAWTFDAPQATLFTPGTDTHVGTHSTGPTWTWSDGSSITGMVSAKRDGAQANDVPWLLLKTHPVSTATGTLARVVWVRRSNTKGGAAPTTGCDSQHQGTVQQVPYTALYTFYSGGSPVSVQ